MKEWTPTIGWLKAAWQIPVRVAIALALAWAGLWLLRSFIGWLEVEMNEKINGVGWGMILLLAVAFGSLAGLVVSRKLSEGTGLVGSHLLLPACGLLVAGLCGLHWVTASYLPVWERISFYLFGMMGIVACAMAVKQFLFDT